MGKALQEMKKVITRIHKNSRRIANKVNLLTIAQTPLRKEKRTFFQTPKKQQRHGNRFGA